MIYQALLYLFFILTPASILAGVVHVGSFRDTWQVYKVTDNRGAPEQCYIRGMPNGVDKSDDPAALPESYILLRRKVAGPAVMPVGVATGHALHPKHKVKLTFDEKKYNLQPSTVGARDTAWATDEAQDKDLVKEMMRGRTLQVSSKNPEDEVVDATYSLLGFKAAVAALEVACFPQKVHGSGALKESALQKIDLRGKPANPKPASARRKKSNPRPPVFVEVKIDPTKKRKT